MVDHVLKFFSFYFFIPLSQQCYCGIASHFGKSPYFDVKFSYLDDFLKVLVFSRGGRSCWTWPWNMSGSESRARPGWNCGSSSLLLISQNFFILWWEGTGDYIIDFCQKLQDFDFTGFRMGSWAPQELLTWRITVGNLAVLQVLHRHKVFGDELPGLSVDEVFSPSIYSHHIQESPDVFLSSTVALHDDQTQNCHQETGLR